MTVTPVTVDREAMLTPPMWPDGSTGPWSDTAPHAGFLDGATVTVEAARHGLSVRIGLWLDGAGSVRQARWRAVKDPALRACAEAACVLLESGADLAQIDAAAVRRLAHPGEVMDPAYAEVVAAAVEAGARLSLSPARP